MIASDALQRLVSREPELETALRASFQRALAAKLNGANGLYREQMAQTGAPAITAPPPPRQAMEA